MIGIDTNILVRFLSTDDAAQHKRASLFLGSLDGENPAYVSALTLAEAIWVLRRRLGFPMEQILDAVRELLASDAICFEHGERLGTLLNNSQPAGRDLTDHLIAWSAQQAGCLRTLTFDNRAAKTVASMELLS